MSDQPMPRNWCRVSLQVSLVTPRPGRVLCLERSERTVRVLICAPRMVVAAALIALFGQHPWVAGTAQWLAQRAGW